MRQYRGVRITLYVAIALSMITVILMFITFAFQSPIGLLVGVPTAAIYLAIGLAIFRFTPMWPQPALGLTLAALGWGSGFAISAVFLVAGAWGDITTKLDIPAAEMSFSGAYPEEIIKAAGVMAFLLCFPQLNRPWHGFVVGGLIGLGFDTFENLGYAVIFGMLDPNSDAAGAASVWTLRIVAGPYLHVILSSIAGYGLALAMLSGKRTPTGAPIGLGRRLAYAIGGFAIAFLAHFMWNYQPDSVVVNTVVIVVVSLIIYPLFIAVWIHCYKEAKAEKASSTVASHGAEILGNRAGEPYTATFAPGSIAGQAAPHPAAGQPQWPAPPGGIPPVSSGAEASFLPQMLPATMQPPPMQGGQPQVRPPEADSRHD